MHTKLTLKKATNNTGITYSQVQFALADKLTPEQAELMKTYAESVKSITRNIDFAESDVDETVTVNTETGEVVQPL